MHTPSFAVRSGRILPLAALLFSAALAVMTGAQSPPAPKPLDPPASKPAEQPREYVLMTTSMGDIVIELDREHAPISTANFLAYVDKGFYDGTIFHRVIPTFMVQGGGFTPEMQQKPTDRPIKNEWQNGLKNKRGTLAMARTAAADSATAQFFINVADNASLDEAISGGAGYAVFGQVFAGMPVVDEIRGVKTGRHGPHSDVPVEPVKIVSAKHITAEQAKEKADAEKGKSSAPAKPADQH